MDNLSTYLSGYWWVVALPVALMVFVWFFRGRGLKLAFLLLSAGVVFLYFSSGTPAGVGGALNQIVNSVTQVVRQVGASFL